MTDRDYIPAYNTPSFDEVAQRAADALAALFEHEECSAHLMKLTAEYHNAVCESLIEHTGADIRARFAQACILA